MNSTSGSRLASVRREVIVPHTRLRRTLRERARLTSISTSEYYDRVLTVLRQKRQVWLFGTSVLDTRRWEVIVYKARKE